MTGNSSRQSPTPAQEGPERLQAQYPQLLKKMSVIAIAIHPGTIQMFLVAIALSFYAAAQPNYFASRPFH